MGSIWSQPGPLDHMKRIKYLGENFNDFKQSRRKLEHFISAVLYTYRPSVLCQALTSAHLLGASPVELTLCFEEWAPKIGIPWPEDDDPIADSIGKFNIDNFLGQVQYEKRFFDYFRDELTENWQWYTLIDDHIDELWGYFHVANFRGMKELATAVELDNGLVACNALTMVCTEPLPKKLEEAPPHCTLEAEVFLTVREALASNSYHPVVNTQSLMLIFMSNKFPKLNDSRKIALLQELRSTFEDAEPFENFDIGELVAIVEKDLEGAIYAKAHYVLMQML